jgi:nucleolar protein 15
VEKLEEKPTAISKSNSGKAVKNKKKEQEKEDLAVLKPAPTEEQAFDEFSSDEEENTADQSAALLAGFESSSEESGGEEEGMPLDQVPQAKLSKKEKKALATAQKDGEDTPGTLYIGYICPFPTHPEVYESILYANQNFFIAVSLMAFTRTKCAPTSPNSAP